MSAVTNYHCDVCGHQRGEANHWASFGFDRRTLENGEEGRGLTIYAWDPAASLHVCGPRCAVTLIARYYQLLLEGQFNDTQLPEEVLRVFRKYQDLREASHVL